MKVWYITTGFPLPSETFATTEVRTLHQHGVDISVHGLMRQPREADQLAKQRDIGQINTTHTTTGGILHGLFAAFCHPIVSADLLWLILRTTWYQPKELLISLLLAPRIISLFNSAKKARPDVVHLFWSHYPALLGYLVGRWMNKTTLSAGLRAYDLKRDYGPTRAALAVADVICTISKSNIKKIEALGVRRESIHVIHDGIDLEQIPQSKASRIDRRIVTVGRFIPGKRIEDVVEVIAILRTSYPDLSLNIFGDGPQRQVIERQIRERDCESHITLRGFVPHEDVLSELATADVFLFLSASEVLPNAVKEAMACGCLCVVGRTEGIEELLTDKVEGYLVEVGDIKQAAARVADCFGDSDMATMRRAAQSRIAAEFSSDISAKKYIELWETAAQSKKCETEFDITPASP